MISHGWTRDAEIYVYSCTKELMREGNIGLVGQLKVFGIGIVLWAEENNGWEREKTVLFIAVVGWRARGIG